MLHGLMVVARRDCRVWRGRLQGESVVVLPVCYLLRQAGITSFTMCWGGGQACRAFPDFSSRYFSPGRALLISREWDFGREPS